MTANVLKTPAKSKLPNGLHLEFGIKPNEQWADLSLSLKTDKVIRALRLDPGNRPGPATIGELTLKNPSGKILQT